MKLKRIKAGEYTTIDGKYLIFKDYDEVFGLPVWYLYDAETYKSLCDSESTLWAIKDRLKSYLNK